MSVAIDGEERPMCCRGCEAVARTIVDAGQEDFYRRRIAPPRTAAETVPDLAVYDAPEIQARYVDTGDGDVSRASLIVEGITCAACAWLIENRLRRAPGIVNAGVNYTTHRANVSWRPRDIRLSDIIRLVESVGYRARPFDPSVHQDVARRDRRSFLLRIGITGALGMQVMMIATAMYFGDGGGMEQDYRRVFRWLSLCLTVPIIAYGAAPFFRGAWRDLRNAALGMDVPVSVGLGVAFAGSAWATWTGQGPVYYESVAMFVFLLLCARFLESGARHRSIATVEALNRSLPELAERRAGDGTWETVSASVLSPGDVVRVSPGQAFPADGDVIEGSTSVNESLLTGEATPVAKSGGASVLAGSINVDQPVLVQVARAHVASTLSQIIRLTEQAQTYKPRLAQLADRAASWFVAGVLLLAAGAGVYWSGQAGQNWLPVVVAVLVVTCPCALSLATPAAVTTAVNALAHRSVVPVSGAALETLARVDTLMLDKTGTLTEGRLSVDGITCLDGRDNSQIRRIAAALNQSSRHPVARALRADWRGAVPAVSDERHESGGVSGLVEGNRYYIGNAEYIHARTGTRPPADPSGPLTRAWLASGDGLLARIDFVDRVRRDARDMLDAVGEAGVRVILCSGDHAAAVDALADRLGIDDRRAGMTPPQKLEALRTLQRENRVVAAVGDGTNDAPFLSAADVSLAMADGADLARVNADMVLLGDSLRAVPEAFRIARRTRAIVRQNIAWAVGYNLLALPAAAAGIVPPWLAAIGMSLSSLIVVSNALRLNSPPRAARSPVRQVEPAAAPV